MEFFINIEDAAGVRLGDGPITSALEWRHSPALDGAGDFAFRMPANDPKARVLGNRRIARCYGILGGVLQELGAGIIDNIQLDAGDPSILRVSGPDILAELSARTVGSLTVKEQAWRNLADPARGMLAWFRVETDNASVTLPVDIPLAHDGNTSTYETIRIRSSRTGYPESRYYLYVGYDARFDRVEFTFHGGVINTPVSELRMQYYNGEAWVEHAITDGTRVYDAGLGGWVTWNTNGAVTFTRPTDWARYTAAYGAGNWFWVRFYLADDAGARVTGSNVRLAEARVYADVPTTDGVNQIMAYAPSTWTRTGYPQTVNPAYLEFDGESVLTALITLTEQGGQTGGAPVREHFRLGAGRSVDWRGIAWEATGLRAVQATGDTAQEGLSDLCLISGLTERRDSADLVTRIYPRSSDGVPVSLTSRSAPTGYTLSKANNYLERDASMATYGLIEAWAEFPSVGLQQADSFTEHPEFAADQVFDRALEVLRSRGVVARFYDLDVVSVQGRVLPGTTIRVTYREALDGATTVDIDDLLYVLGSTLVVDEDGLCTVGLDVATMDRRLADDADVLAGAIRDSRRSGSASVSIASTIVHTEAAPPSGEATITGGTIDNVIIGGSVPRTGYFTYLHANVGGQVAGWTIEPGRLVGANIGLYSTGYIAAGVDNQTVRISGQGTDTYRLWVGHAYAEHAPFRVSQDGYMEAANAVIEGDITATTGELVDLSVTGALILSDDGIICSDNYVQDTSGWLIGADGGAEFSDAIVRGHIEAATGELGTLSVTGTLTLVDDGVIQSDNYAAGLRGWRITHDGEAEFQNAIVRGRISTAVFEYDQISATAGTLLIAPSAGVLAEPFTTSSGSMNLMLLEDSNYWLFESGDLVRIRARDIAGGVSEAWITVTRPSLALEPNIYLVTFEHGDYATWPEGTAVVSYGQGGGGTLQMTASMIGAPHYSVRVHGLEPWQDETEVVRMGNLDGSYGIITEDFGLGIGDYSASNYLRYTQAEGFKVSAGDGALSIDEEGLLLGDTGVLGSKAMIRFSDFASLGGEKGAGNTYRWLTMTVSSPRQSPILAMRRWDFIDEDEIFLGFLPSQVGLSLIDDAITGERSCSYYGDVFKLGNLDCFEAAFTGPTDFSGALTRSGRTCRILVDSNHIQTPATVNLTTAWATVLYFDLTIPNDLTGTILAQATLNCLCDSFTSSTNIFARLLIDGSPVQSIHGEWSRVWERVPLTLTGRASGLAAGARRVEVQVYKGSANANGYVIAAEGFLMAQAYA